MYTQNTACRAQKFPPYRIHYSYRCVQRKKEKNETKRKGKREKTRLVPCLPLGIYPENVKYVQSNKKPPFCMYEMAVAPITFPSCAPGRRQ
jgi:hypothetical protein